MSGRPSQLALDAHTLDLLRGALAQLQAGFAHLPDANCRLSETRVEGVLAEVAERMRDNFPYFHPLYAGQMMKPPHPVARLAYALAMYINPNNHALDGGRASSQMEKEAVAEIARMVGWREHLGHLTSGGTLANLEALWIAGRLKPGAAVLASEQAHYTHSRISGVLGLEFESVACDGKGRIDLAALEERLAHGPPTSRRGGVGAVVATLGTTATGSVDPLPEILALRERYGFRVHADAAYGGYFTLTDNLAPEARRAFDCLADVDSIVIDPHKHGLQPYGCGCVLFRDPSVGRFYKHDSPYTYFSSADLHLGEISLECSRPGAAAVALWATQRLLPLVRGGEFAQSLGKCGSAALALYEKLRGDQRFIVAFPPELDILVWAPRPKASGPRPEGAGASAPRVSEASELSRRLFAEASKRHLHLALAHLPAKFFALDGIEQDSDTVTCLRSVLMKPEHLDWLDRIWLILDESTKAIVSSRIAQTGR
ncbi:MAG: pyridoxal phosphate-dependent decarboxylase family protein [Candidatus Acidiferrales bacterium]